MEAVIKRSPNVSLDYDYYKAQSYYTLTDEINIKNIISNNTSKKTFMYNRQLQKATDDHFRINSTSILPRMLHNKHRFHKDKKLRRHFAGSSSTVKHFQGTSTLLTIMKIRHNSSTINQSINRSKFIQHPFKIPTQRRCRPRPSGKEQS